MIYCIKRRLPAFHNLALTNRIINYRQHLRGTSVVPMINSMRDEVEGELTALPPPLYRSGRYLRHTLKASGVMVAPTLPFKLGSGCPEGRVIWNECINEEKKRNSSMRANTSPRHIRRPTPNGIKYSGLQTLPSALIKRRGLNSSGLSQRFGSMWTLLISGITWEPAGIL